MKQKLVSVIGLLLCLMTIKVESAIAQGSSYDKAWKFAEWYKNDRNPTIQSVLFIGRFQYEFADVDSDQGNNREWNVRRLRLGAKSTLFKTITVHGEAEFNPQEHDPFYMRITDLYVQWKKSSRLTFKVGKQAVEFTTEGSTSSKELLTIDRSNFANNIWFPQEYMPGFSVFGEHQDWIYHAGVYSGGTANRELGEFDGSAFTLLTLGHDFAAALDAKDALLTVNYVYQDPSRANTFTRQLQHVVSVNFEYEKNKLGLRSDLSTAEGYLGQSDIRGAMIMPFVNITPKLQAVARGTFLRSDGNNGLRLATYESRVVGGRGDRYNELYLGANYYFYGHKLKLQSGLQFGDMNDKANDGGTYSGTSWTTGLRVSW